MRVFLIFLLYSFNLTKVFSAGIPIIEYLGTENGLSHNMVRCIYQDPKGFMWFGTRDGLDRYDGYGFEVFRNKFNDKNSLVHNIVHAITSDANDRLWIGTRKGVSVYTDLFGRFTTVNYYPTDDKVILNKATLNKASANKKILPFLAVVRDLMRDGKGRMLIGSEGLGLLYCEPGKFTATQIPLETQDKVSVRYGVQSIKIDKKGQVWVFVQNLGLCRLDYRYMKLKLVSTDIALAICMETDGDNIWLGTNNGLFCYHILQHKTDQSFADKRMNTLGAVNSLHLDVSGGLYIGTINRGIYIYKDNRLNDLLQGGNDNSVNNGIIHAIYIDKDARTWIGTSVGGINIIDPTKKKFETISHIQGNENSLVGNAISAFCEDHHHDLWIGTENSGLSVWNRQRNTFVNYINVPGNPKSVSSNVITSAEMDYKNEIWIGTFTDGLNRYNRATNDFTRYKCIDPQTGIESKVVFTLFQDRDSVLWAGTLRRGTLLGALYRLNRAANKFELFDIRLSDLFVLTEDSKGTLWGGNLNQLIKIDKAGKKHRFYDVGYTVRAIYEDVNHNLWVGTEGGGMLLFDRHLNKFTFRYTTENGLSSNSVLSLVDDGSGNVWISTYNGLVKFNLAKRSFKTFFQNDGLQGNQFQVNAALRLNSQEMVFGGVRGFNLFKPSLIVPSGTSPNLRLTGLNVNNVPIELDHSYVTNITGDLITEIKVPYDKAVFSFVFTALEYAAPNKISYAYYMEGLDKGWTSSGNTRKATYTHIDEGYYTFRVKSTNADGIWGKKEIVLRIMVLPPWYRSWWAYLSYTLAISALIYLFLRYRTKQTKLKYEVTIANLNAQREKAEFEMERSEHEKERMISEKEKELNEKRLTFFTNVSHEFRTPLTLIINPVKDLIERLNSGRPEEYRDLNIIYRNARRMLSLVDQLLLFRKTDTGADHINVSKLNFYNLCKDVYLCFTQQANVKMINYDFVAGNKELEIYGDREKIEIVLFNLISNAMKYTPSLGSVKIEIAETSGEVLFSVSDTGYGIPADEGNRIFDRFYQAKRTDNHSKPGFGIGLYLAKQFVEAHSGELFYNSEPGMGTVFFLKLLKGHAHISTTIAEPGADNESVLLKELAADEFAMHTNDADEDYVEEELVSDKQAILIVDDEADIRAYIRNVFKSDYIIYEAENGEAGLQAAYAQLPDLVITDYRMEGLDGIELCMKIKEDPALSYIPVILLTGSSSRDVKLNSLKGGADDYIAKPFEKDYLVARVANLLKNRNNLQSYFYNEITLQSNTIVISEEYKKFLDKCIIIVERHLNDADFGIKSLANEIGMSHSNLYKRVKSISGQSVSAFIRFIRLRKAAEIMINTDCNVNEAAFQTGFNDSKYFSKQFSKLFHLTPSDFIKKHRHSFNKKYKIKTS